MGAEAREPSHCYVVAGVRFTTDREVAGLDTRGFSDQDTAVCFHDNPPDAGAIPLPIPSAGGTAWLDAAGRVHLPRTESPEMRAWLIRQAAPFVAALQGRCVLHASAVSIDRTVVAFVGASGLGKSTLASHLAERRHVPRVADDMLPVRFDGGQVTVPVADDRLPLRTVYFLQRGSPEVATEVLSRVTALNYLIRDGFGELHDARSWSRLFDAYHKIATAVPCLRLLTPNDLRHLDATAELVLRRAAA
jgi:hypothetical protein